MNLYLIAQDENSGYDTYDSAVVVAKDEVLAKAMHPSGDAKDWVTAWPTWADNTEQVTVKLLGKAEAGLKEGVYCASFNAG